MKHKITIEVTNDYAETAWQAVDTVHRLLRSALSDWKITKVEEVKPRD